MYSPPAQVDNIPPVITGCPTNDITVSAAPGSFFAVASWSEPSATDDSNIVPSETQTHAPGSTFNIGRTLVVYRFTDRSGNTATCEFNVVVIRE